MAIYIWIYMSLSMVTGKDGSKASHPSLTLTIDKAKSERSFSDAVFSQHDTADRDSAGT